VQNTSTRPFHAFFSWQYNRTAIRESETSGIHEACHSHLSPFSQTRGSAGSQLGAKARNTRPCKSKFSLSCIGSEQQGLQPRNWIAKGHYQRGQSSIISRCHRARGTSAGGNAPFTSPPLRTSIHIHRLVPRTSPGRQDPAVTFLLIRDFSPTCQA
jgi:hypothetical protein